ncbi:DUF5053 domain-containing protein [uncultured Alistipes sp.]|uniref:DUF5053 domain-containing protein n=1 Tax=uncultured Alistipes sp. TaxID=538949 RepID=UPI00272FF7AE|nr:DUF5053 domain-containing protein [uncultured Alistipes sp.]
MLTQLHTLRGTVRKYSDGVFYCPAHDFREPTYDIFGIEDISPVNFDKNTAIQTSWLYRKLDSTDENGGEEQFTEAELQQFKGALCDLADRIRRVADSL